jgi:ABC-2 type transport system permease protein
MQMTLFYFLPNILLSGFMFPFRGMPRWAQCDRRGAAADALPAHRAGRDAQGRRRGRHRRRVAAIAAFMAAMGTIALLRYRQTID